MKKLGDKYMYSFIHFLGIGSAFNTRFCKTSAYFEYSNQLFLIDCGDGVFNKIVNLKLLEKYQDTNVLITHTHSDHVGSLAQLVLYSYYNLQKIIKIYFPVPKFITDLLELMGVDRNIYIISHNINDTINFDNKIIIEYIKQDHVENLPCFGYIVELDKKRFFYSGDSNSIPEKILKMFLNHEIEYIFQDTCSEKMDNSLHLSFENLVELIPPSERHRVFCIHLDSDFNIENATKIGFNIPEEI